MKRLRSSMPCFVVLVVTAISAYAQDLTAIQKKLVEKYALTQPTADRTDIVTAGAVLTLLKSNLMMVPISDSNLYQNTYKEGRISQNTLGKAKSFFEQMGRLPGVTAASDGNATRTYVAGEKMWVTKIEVKADGKEYGVIFDLCTDPVGYTRYKASLRIPFARGATEDQVDKRVAEVFWVQPAENAQLQQPAAVPVSAATARRALSPVATPTPSAYNAPLPDIAPPPPPADEPAAPPQTISLGQTIDQVVAILGQPQRIANLANKQTYFYKDLKLAFTDGKLTDVQ